MTGMSHAGDQPASSHRERGEGSVRWQKRGKETQIKERNPQRPAIVVAEKMSSDAAKAGQGQLEGSRPTENVGDVRHK